MSSIPMCLGPYMFHPTRFGYNKLGHGLSTNWAEIEIVGGLNVGQWTGGQTDKITINGVIFPEEFGGLSTLKALQLAALAGTILPLITLAGTVYGNFRIDSIEEDQSFHNRYGVPAKDEFSLSLTKHSGSLSPINSIVQTLFG